MGLGECAAIIILLSSAVNWHQKTYSHIKEASTVTDHALDLLCNQGNNISLVVSVVEASETTSKVIVPLKRAVNRRLSCC